MKKIYIVNTGYEDIDHAAFSSPELAKEFMRYFSGEDYNGIKELEIDPPYVKMKKDGYGRWEVLMLKDGTIESAYPQAATLYNITDSFLLWERTKAPLYKNKGIPDVLNCRVWAKSKNQALKIANKERLKMIENGVWK